MSLAYWRDICTTNCPEIDREHSEILGLLESLYQAIQHREESRFIQSQLNHLFEIALIHCQTEERLMETYSYPDHQAHGDEHEALLNTILNLRLKAEHQAEKLTLDMIHDIAAWLSRHCWNYDLKMVQFIQQRQQSEALLFGCPRS